MQGRPTTFWGKLEQDEDKNVLGWHPVEAHCADVAACAEALLQRTILRRRFATLAGDSELTETDIARLSALAALHDIGKFNLGFQRKGDVEPKDTAGHVAEVLSLFGSDHRERELLLEALPTTELATWSEDEGAIRLLFASIGHHGKPVACDAMAPRAELWRPNDALNPFAGIAGLTAWTRRWFPAAFATGGRPLPSGPAFQHAFSGLVMLADWLGSDRHEHMFPFAEDASDRMPFARERARRAVASIGLEVTASRAALGPTPPGFKAISEFEPRDAQAKTLALPHDRAGSLTVLESETGSGKTEAALIRFVRLLHAGLVDGMTFALPTRTAATQLHGRITEAMKIAFPDEATRPSVILAVPGYLRFDDAVGKRLPGFEVLWNDDARERARYRGWAAEQPKRFLAGTVVVGTIDQVLLSSLRVGHAHLRATALLRHLLVVDEVHASDTYMNRILEEVLRYHLLAGGHAFLMSATLGSAVRRRLESAGLGRVDGSAESLSSALEVPYPVVHHSARNEGSRRVKVEAPGLPKTLEVRLDALADRPEELVAQALKAARAGARVLVLRNTVRDAVATQIALEAILEPAYAPLLFRVGETLTLHHARFAAVDRERLDLEIERRFGKKAAAHAGVIAVATQTVQQSLDLDADLLFTDLAPMDVLLQRFGRVHRHKERDGARPAGFEAPRAIVLTGDDPLESYLRSNGEASGKHGAGTVYEDLSILEATRARIAANGRLRIPEDNRELVEVTTHPEALDRLAETLGGLWPKHRQTVGGKHFAQAGIAQLNLVDRTQPFGDYSFKRTDLEERIASRLGESDRRVPFEPASTGPFGLPLRLLNLPGWLARGVPADPDLQATNVSSHFTALGRVTRFRFGEEAFVYDRLGLRRDDTPTPDEDLADA